MKNLTVRADGPDWTIRADGPVEPEDKVAREAITKLGSRLEALLSTDLPALFKAQFEPLSIEVKALKDKKVDPVVPPPPEKKEETVLKGLSPEVNALILDMKRNQDDTNKKLAAAEAKSKENEDKAERVGRESVLKTELSKYTFIKPEVGADDAFKLLFPSIERNDKGELVAGGLPVDAFVKDRMTTHLDYMLGPAPGTTGTGATKGASRGGSGTVNMEDIKPGSTPEQFAAIGAHIAQVLQG